MNIKHFLFAALALTTGLTANAVTTTNTLNAVADTVIHNFVPTNNIGGSIAIAAGATGQGIARSLIRFDLSSIPAGVTITGVKVILNLDRASSGPGSTFELHRMLKSWTEGTKSSSQRLVGAGATDGEVTWSHRIWPATLWQAEGAGGEQDALTNISASLFMNALGVYPIPSTPELIADVQAWLATPSTNFGWMIKCASEGTPQTARVFSTKEAGNPPKLEITYESLVVSELKIQTIQISNGIANLTWTGGATPYRIERAPSPTGPWTLFPTTTQLQGSAPLEGPLNFFRVAGQVP